MKVTIYTISTCPFCKQEKDYLKKNNTQFEEKNLEQNRQWLTEMLERSDNFAGVPFTVIEKDDGSQVKLKGFTRQEFDKALGLAEAPTEPAKEKLAEEKPAEEKPAAAPAPASPPALTETPTAEEVAEQPATEEPTTQKSPTAAKEKEPELDEKLKGVLSNLQSMSTAEKSAEMPVAKTPPTETGAAEQSEQVKQEKAGEASSTGDLPNIPDFPKKE